MYIHALHTVTTAARVCKSERVHVYTHRHTYIHTHVWACIAFRSEGTCVQKHTRTHIYT